MKKCATVCGNHKLRETTNERQQVLRCVAHRTLHKLCAFTLRHIPHSRWGCAFIHSQRLRSRPQVYCGLGTQNNFCTEFQNSCLCWNITSIGLHSSLVFQAISRPWFDMLCCSPCQTSTLVDVYCCVVSDTWSISIGWSVASLERHPYFLDLSINKDLRIFFRLLQQGAVFDRSDDKITLSTLVLKLKLSWYQ